MADTLSMVSIISFLAAGMFAILTVTLWFLFHIPTVAGDLSGRNAKRTIERMRKNNEKTGKSNQEQISVKRAVKNPPADIRLTVKGRSERAGVETGLQTRSLAGVYQSEETKLLKDENVGVEEVETERKPSTVRIEMLEKILLVHTEEVIG